MASLLLCIPLALPRWQHLDPGLREGIVSKSKGRTRRTGLPINACDLTPTGGQLNVSFPLSPGDSHILSLNSDVSLLSVITDVFENLMKGSAHLLRKMYIYTKISCKSKWLLISHGFFTPVLGTKGCRDRSSKTLYEGASGQQDPHPYPTSWSKCSADPDLVTTKPTSNFEQRQVHFLPYFGFSLRLES